MELLNTAKAFVSVDQKHADIGSVWKDYYHTEKSNQGFKGFSFNDKNSQEAKAQTINALFSDILQNRTGYKIEDMAMNGDMGYATTQFANLDVVRVFANQIQDYLIEMVLPETLWGDFNLFADIKFGGYTDSFSFDIESNELFTVPRAGYRQNYTPAQRLEDTTVTLVPVNHQITVATNLAEILAGRQFLARYLMKAVRSIETQMMYDVYDTVIQATDQAIMPPDLVMTNFTETAAITMAERITAWNNGRKALFVGTPVALKKILPDSQATRILLDDSYVKIGQLQQFNNYDVMPIGQIADYTKPGYKLKLKDDIIHVVSIGSDKILKMAVGNTMSYQNGPYDNADRTILGTVCKPWEVMCATNSVVGTILLP